MKFISNLEFYFIFLGVYYNEQDILSEIYPTCSREEIKSKLEKSIQYPKLRDYIFRKR